MLKQPISFGRAFSLFYFCVNRNRKFLLTAKEKLKNKEKKKLAKTKNRKSIYI